MGTNVAPGSLNIKLRGLIRLTRWKEVVPFTTAVTILGALLAVQNLSAKPDIRLLAVLAANLLVVGYAFMINDVVDAPDDAREEARAARNPICVGELSPREGWIASLLVAVLALLVYAALGGWPLLIGGITLAISHFYSWKPVRLKAWPVADVLSHVLMLSGLLWLAGYFAYDSAPGSAWMVALAVTLISCYGQLYNQIRDYDMDVHAGLKNTAIVLGKRPTQIIMYGAIGLGVALLVAAWVSGVLPIWLPVAGLAVIPLLWVFRVQGDARGGAAIDLSGNFQQQLLIMANAAMLAWLFAMVAGLA